VLVLGGASEWGLKWTLVLGAIGTVLTVGFFTGLIPMAAVVVAIGVLDITMVLVWYGGDVRLW
jgi:hypothetical protein